MYDSELNRSELIGNASWENCTLGYRCHRSFLPRLVPCLYANLSLEQSIRRDIERREREISGWGYLSTFSFLPRRKSIRRLIAVSSFPSLRSRPFLEPRLDRARDDDWSLFAHPWSKINVNEIYNLMYRFKKTVEETKLFFDEKKESRQMTKDS